MRVGSSRHGRSSNCYGRSSSCCGRSSNCCSLDSSLRLVRWPACCAVILGLSADESQERAAQGHEEADKVEEEGLVVGAIDQRDELLGSRVRDRWLLLDVHEGPNEDVAVVRLGRE